jgi:hypothetical protein
VNLRLTTTLLRDPAKEKLRKEKAEAPTVKTEKQVQAEEAAKAKGEDPATAHKVHPLRRKFRPLSEEKAVDLFADVIGDAFILSIAVGLLLWEYVKQSQKPDTNALKISELKEELKEKEKHIAELEEAEKRTEQRLSILELALDNMKFPKGQEKAEQDGQVAA